MDSSYNVYLNVSVWKGIKWVISVHSIHKEGLFSQVCIFNKVNSCFEIKGRCTKRKRQSLKIYKFVFYIEVVSSSSGFFLWLHMVIVLNNYQIPSCYDLHLGSYIIKDHGMLLGGGLFILGTTNVSLISINNFWGINVHNIR